MGRRQMHSPAEVRLPAAALKPSCTWPRQSLWQLLMTMARNLCVAVIYTDVRGEVQYYARQASEESGTPPVAGAAQHGSVGIRRRGAAAAMARTRGGGDHRPKRDRRRRRTGLGGMNGG